MNTIYSYASAEGHGDIEWIGTAGAAIRSGEGDSRTCKSGCHSNGNALDITAIEFGNTSFDMKASWRSSQSLAQRRGYLAIWAGLRIFCTTVISNTYDSDHEDHFHVDNDGRGLSVPPAIRKDAKTDTTLVQVACNLLNDANLVIDGNWRTATTRAYNDLLEAFGMDCLSPKTNYWHARTFLILLMRHGFASESAGGYTYPYCD